MICCLSLEGIRDRLLEPPEDPSGIFGVLIVGPLTVDLVSSYELREPYPNQKALRRPIF